MPMSGSLISNSRRLGRSLVVGRRNLHERLFNSKALVQAEKTVYEVIHEQSNARLRYYPPLRAETIDVVGSPIAVQDQSHRIPLVLVAPLGVNMLIYDLFPERSLVKYLRARGFELYLIDWGQHSSNQAHFNFKTYIAELMPALLEQVRRHNGQRQLSLHGWSFGGLLSYCYAAFNADPDIANLVLLGAPCDYHGNGKLGPYYQGLSKAFRWLDARTRLRPHATPPRWWQAPGWANSLAFKMTNPVGSLRGYTDLLARLTDREFVSRHATNAAFLDGMVGYTGGVMQDVLQYLLVDNVLATSRLPIAGNIAGLDRIKARLLLVSGREDIIVSLGCSGPILELAGSVDKTLLEVPGGHMGILSGSAAPRHIWPQVADWLAERS